MELQDGVFEGLCKLAWLDLSYNRISSIGLGVFNNSAMLTSLRGVYLQYNRIASLEPWPLRIGWTVNAHNKVPIDLSHNNISAFANRMGWKAKCDVTVHIDLNLGFIPIKHISDVLRGWNISIDTTLCLNKQPPAASHFSFHGIYMHCDCVDFNVIKMIRFAHHTLIQNIYCKNPSDFNNMVMHTVPLNDLVCELKESCPSACRCVHRPANATLHVYCSNTNITVLPFELPELPKSYTKYKLNFSNNRFLRRLEYRDYFVNTSILDVSNCNLDSSDFVMWMKLANITQVFLAGNRLQSLPSSVASVSLETAHIGLGRNPWKCSCDAIWMSGWLKSVNHSLINPDGIACSSPQRLKDRKMLDISDVLCGSHE